MFQENYRKNYREKVGVGLKPTPTRDCILRLLLSSESVADISYGFNENMRGVLDLAPQPGDVYIDCPIAAVVIVAPDLIEQLLPGKDVPSVARQEYKQLVLFECQSDRFLVEG